MCTKGGVSNRHAYLSSHSPSDDGIEAIWEEFVVVAIALLRDTVVLFRVGYPASVDQYMVYGPLVTRCDNGFVLQ